MLGGLPAQGIEPVGVCRLSTRNVAHPQPQIKQTQTDDLLLYPDSHHKVILDLRHLYFLKGEFFLTCVARVCCWQMR